MNLKVDIKFYIFMFVLLPVKVLGMSCGEGCIRLNNRIFMTTYELKQRLSTFIQNADINGCVQFLPLIPRLNPEARRAYLELAQENVLLQKTLLKKNSFQLKAAYLSIISAAGLLANFGCRFVCSTNDMDDILLQDSLPVFGLYIAHFMPFIYDEILRLYGDNSLRVVHSIISHFD